MHTYTSEVQAGYRLQGCNTVRVSALLTCRTQLHLVPFAVFTWRVLSLPECKCSRGRALVCFVLTLVGIACTQCNADT